MLERSAEQQLSSVHKSVQFGAEKALVSGREELETPSELPGDLVRRARQNLNGQARDWSDVYAEVLRVAMNDLNLSGFEVETGETRRFNDGQPGFFLVRREADKPDFRFEESVSGELMKNKRTASGERVKRQQP